MSANPDPSPVSRVVVVGGGIAGLTLSTALAQKGVDVVLAERSSRLNEAGEREWLTVGHGLTIQGNALRAFASIGVVEEIIERGHPFDNLRLLRPDGGVITAIPTPPMGGPGLPGTCGALRSDVQEILARAATAAGVDVRLGTSVTAYADHGDAVSVTLADEAGQESVETAALLVAADGIRSSTRKLMGIEAEPSPVGMGIWRVVAKRPREMECSDLYYGGPKYKAGYTPISEDLCYAFLLEENLPRDLIGEHPHGKMLKEHGAGYGGIWGEVIASIEDDAMVNYAWIESIQVPEPWFRGRAIAIGDAVHACPPLIAQGAAMCAEDGVVLAEMLTSGEPIEQVLPAFMARRLPRVSMVLDNSLRLAAFEIAPSDDVDPGALMGQTLHAMCTPA